MIVAEVRVYRNKKWTTCEKRFSDFPAFANWLDTLYNRARWAFRYQTGFWFEAKTHAGVEINVYPVREV